MYKEEDFDIMVKSTLESGAEDVPGGLWEGVEKRLATTEPVRVSRRWLWKRWTAGIAFVCMAACGLLLLIPHSEESIVPVMTPSSVVVPAPDVTPATVSDAVAELTETGVSAKMTKTIKTAQTSSVTESDGIEESVDLYGNEATKVENTVKNTGQAPRRTEQATEHTARNNDGQSLILENESPERRIRIALTGSAMSGGHAGERSSIANRMSTSQMDFGSEEKIYESAGTFYLMPISAGLGVRINFTKHWALGVGLNYTFLHRRFEGLYDYGGTENYYCDNIANNQHYIGIPINAYYNIITGNRLKFYVYAGGSIEKCVSNSYSFNYYGYTKVLKQSIGGIQASANAGLGLQFCITDRFGIYFDPSFRYYFRNYLQPKSIRTAQPFQINAELGLRWDL